MCVRVSVCVCVPENPTDFELMRVQIQIGELDVGVGTPDSRNKINRGDRDIPSVSRLSSSSDHFPYP